MKNALALVMLVITFSVMRAQSLTKYDIGSTGCQINMPADPNFEVSYSEDSAEVWTGEAESDGHFYATICVQFNGEMDEDREGLITLLKSYFDFLQEQFGVVSTSRYGEGNQLAQYTDVYGAIDHWEDADGLEYSVMGWINNKYLTVLIVYGDEEADYGTYNTFFQGLRFPEE